MDYSSPGDPQFQNFWSDLESLVSGSECTAAYASPVESMKPGNDVDDLVNDNGLMESVPFAKAPHSTERRKEQNRKAQRAFRLRQEQRQRDLLKTIQDLQLKNARLEAANETLHALLRRVVAPAGEVSSNLPLAVEDLQRLTDKVLMPPIDGDKERTEWRVQLPLLRRLHLFVPMTALATVTWEG